MLIVALLAVVVAATAYLVGGWSGLESTSIDLRFSLAQAERPNDVLVVAVDGKTLNTLRRRWPFPRSLDARAVDVLHADGARTIVYDVQFTQPTVPGEDLALFEAVGRAHGVILATTEIGPGGSTNVLGGDANLTLAHARAAASILRPNSSGVIEKYPYSVGGLKSLAVVAAEQASGRTISPSDFQDGSAWIDFRGPNGTVPSVSFSDLIDGRVRPAQVAGKVVVIGATSAVLQDVHLTSTSKGAGMSGPEVQANAIWTALHGNPLRQAPGWIALLSIALAGIATPLCCLKMRATRALGCSLLLAVAYVLIAQVAFNANLILVVTYPLAAVAVGALGALLVSYLMERWERQLTERYGAMLEATVRERTAELRHSALELKETQIDAIHRLAQAAELRDEGTGLHIERIGELCELLALRSGMAREDSERIRLASALHDVGKIGIPDRILLKHGRLDDREWEVMKEHTTAGARLLAKSTSSLIQMAETIARTHHEHWDGNGYPNGLRGTEIPLAGRICAICDAFDAMSSNRPYKDSWPLDRVIDEIARSRGSHFDPDLVDIFLTLIPELERAHARASSETPTASGHELLALGIEAQLARGRRELINHAL
jgi:response regulator RpfG family c-di-GMP phosphodiesterase